MSEAILIFTFGPVQPFIAEARRASDLFVGSKILATLASTVRDRILELSGQGSLIYPTAKAHDVPNKIVARVAWENAEVTAKEAKKALLQKWQEIINDSRCAMMTQWHFPVDACWEEIWQRQTTHLWEVYWAIAKIQKGDYAQAYREASAALEGTKRTRVFDACEEPGLKDSISGARQALHTHNLSPKIYWYKMSEKIPIRAKLRSKGRERLDAIGSIKRFSSLAKSLLSTSTVAAEDFLDLSRTYLRDYRQSVERLLDQQHLYKVRESDSDWPYDGDLLFLETLTQDRLQDSYRLSAPNPSYLEEARQRLKQLYKQIGGSPSPYYAIILLDGDDMGKAIRGCLQASDAEVAHRDFSQRLSEFSDYVRQVVAPQFLIYNGGDDVLALAPLSNALSLSQQLQQKFRHIVGSTASAGIAIAHHLYPLDATLTAARQAERQAKSVPGKATVCVRVLKRSGETTEMRSPWDAMGDTFSCLVKFFGTEALSNRFAYTVAESAYGLPYADDMFKAEVHRQIARHQTDKWSESEFEWAARLCTWASTLPNTTEELGNWLIFARFVAKGGKE